MKRKIYYLFYVLYKFWEDVSVPKFWSEIKALITIDIMILFIISSFFYYFDLSFGNKSLFLFLVILMSLFIGYFFLRDDVWKKNVKDFDNLSEFQNRKGKFIVLGLVVIIITNFIVSIYYMDLRSRKNQTGPYSKEYYIEK